MSINKYNEDYSENIAYRDKYWGTLYWIKHLSKTNTTNNRHYLILSHLSRRARVFIIPLLCAIHNTSFIYLLQLHSTCNKTKLTLSSANIDSLKNGPKNEITSSSFAAALDNGPGFQDGKVVSYEGSIY